MPQTTKKPTRATSTKTKPKKKAVPEFAKPFYKKRWFAIFALILVFSAIGGGYMIRRGDAATYTFIRRTPQMAILADGSPNKEIKNDGISYKLIAGSTGGLPFGATISSFLTKQEATQSARICTHYKVFQQGKSPIILWIRQIDPAGQRKVIRESTQTLPLSAQSGNLCFGNPSHIDSTIEVMHTGTAGATVGIDTIYGLY